MGLSDDFPDDDPLLLYTVRLDIVNNILCTQSARTKAEIDAWQRYVFLLACLYGRGFQYGRLH